MSIHRQGTVFQTAPPSYPPGESIVFFFEGHRLSLHKQIITSDDTLHFPTIAFHPAGIS